MLSVPSATGGEGALTSLATIARASGAKLPGTIDGGRFPTRNQPTPRLILPSKELYPESPDCYLRSCPAEANHACPLAYH